MAETIPNPLDKALEASEHLIEAGDRMTAFRISTIRSQIEQLGLDPNDRSVVAGALAGALIVLNRAQEFGFAHGLDNDQISELRNQGRTADDRPDLVHLAEYTVAIGKVWQETQ